MDRSIGKVLQAVKDLGIEEDTLVVFSSDNGPEGQTGVCVLLSTSPVLTQY